MYYFYTLVLLVKYLNNSTFDIIVETPDEHNTILIKYALLLSFNHFILSFYKLHQTIKNNNE